MVRPGYIWTLDDDVKYQLLKAVYMYITLCGMGYLLTQDTPVPEY